MFLVTEILEILKDKIIPVGQLNLQVTIINILKIVSFFIKSLIYLLSLSLSLRVHTTTRYLPLVIPLNLDYQKESQGEVLYLKTNEKAASG